MRHGGRAGRMLGLTIACGLATANAAAQEAPTYRDPFAYCAAVGTVDAPDRRHTGPALPPTIARGLQKATPLRPTRCGAGAPRTPPRISSRCT